jgi:preprotein translocase subunit SecD
VLADQPVVKNGVRSVFSIDLEDLAPADRKPALDRAVRAIRGRLQLADIKGHVSIDGDNLVIDLATTDPEVAAHALDLIRRRGHLELHFVEPGSAFMQALADHVRSDPAAAGAQIVVGLDRWVTPDGTHVTDRFLEAPDRKRDALGAYVSKLDAHLAVPDDRRLGYEQLRSGSWRTYLLERRVVLTGRSIARATATHDRDLDLWNVDVALDRAGTATFASETTSHVGHKLALELDGVVVAAPLLESAITKGRVLLPLASDDPKSETEARDVAIVLTAGELPGPVVELAITRLVDGVPRDDR